MFASQHLQSTELLESPRGNSKIMQNPSTSIACRRRKQNLEKQRRTGSKRPWKPRRLCRAPVGKIWGCINTCGTTFVGIHLPAILHCFGVHQDTIVFNTRLFYFIYCFGILVRDHPMRQLMAIGTPGLFRVWHSLTKQEPKEGEPKGVVYLGAELGDWDDLGWLSDQSCDGRIPGIPQVLPIFIDFRLCLLMLVDVGCHSKQLKKNQLKSLIFLLSTSRCCDWSTTEHYQRSYPWWFLRAAD